MDGKSSSATARRVMLRLLPFLMLLLFINHIDRSNISYAALQMNHDLGLTPEVYGFAAGIFFIGYVSFEIPSNFLLTRFGARRWIARIMITWGLIATAMAWVNGATSLYALRFLLGFAEAGFLPGMFYYLGLWMPARARGKAISFLMSTSAITNVIGAPLSTWLLTLDGLFGLRGWQLMFLLEGLPAVVMGFGVLRRPAPPRRQPRGRKLARRVRETPAARYPERGTRGQRGQGSDHLQTGADGPPGVAAHGGVLLHRLRQFRRRLLAAADHQILGECQQHGGRVAGGAALPAGRRVHDPVGAPFGRHRRPQMASGGGGFHRRRRTRGRRAGPDAVAVVCRLVCRHRRNLEHLWRVLGPARGFPDRRRRRQRLRAHQQLRHHRRLRRSLSGWLRASTHAEFHRQPAGARGFRLGGDPARAV